MKCNGVQPQEVAVSTLACEAKKCICCALFYMSVSLFPLSVTLGNIHMTPKLIKIITN